jgi:hypothetical protein
MHLTATIAIGTQAAGRPARRGRAAQRLDRACSNGEEPVGEPYLGHKRRPPARGDIDHVAVDLIRRRGREILATARRYAYNLDDADDAYQRGLEILLTKAPTTREDDLVRWLQTVVKHEAFARHRQRQRHAPVTDDGQLGERSTPPEITRDQAERYERLPSAPRRSRCSSHRRCARCGSRRRATRVGRSARSPAGAWPPVR